MLVFRRGLLFRGVVHDVQNKKFPDGTQGCDNSSYKDNGNNPRGTARMKSVATARISGGILGFDGRSSCIVWYFIREGIRSAFLV